jgi:hypothetical protein
MAGWQGLTAISGYKPSGNTGVPCGDTSQNSPDTQSLAHALTRFGSGTCLGERDTWNGDQE